VKHFDDDNGPILGVVTQSQQLCVCEKCRAARPIPRETEDERRVRAQKRYVANMKARALYKKGLYQPRKEWGEC